MLSPGNDNDDHASHDILMIICSDVDDNDINDDDVSRSWWGVITLGECT